MRKNKTKTKFTIFNSNTFRMLAWKERDISIGLLSTSFRRI